MRHRIKSITVTHMGGRVCLVVALPTPASWGALNMTPTDALLYAEQVRNAAIAEMKWPSR
jgi:hypothetical protein